MTKISIQNKIHVKLPLARLRKAVRLVLKQHDKTGGVTIVFTDNEQVHELNHLHRGVDSPTDVLSFPAEQLPFEMDDEPPYLGDLIVAYPYTVAQAERLGHDLDDTLTLLVIHGTLHLLGYDHDTPENRKTMWAAQQQGLESLGIPLDIVPALEEAQ